jgi:phage/plasmid-like protein (TIGR03299 family)
MYNLLDSIIDDMESPRVINTQHDLQKIDVTGDMAGRAAGKAQRIAAIRSGSWDQAEYGMSAEAAIAQIEKAETAEELAAVERGFVTMAIRRAGLDTSNGRVAVFTAGKLPWHGLGVTVAEATSSAHAIKLAGMDWPVKKQQLFYVDHNGDTQTADSIFGIVRTDTGRILGSVGNRYKPIQNSEGFEFLDSLLSKFGAKYESAGALHGGKKVWMLAHMPEQGFTINGGDRQEAYVLFENSHDGSGAAEVYPTSVRVVCANTLRMSHKDSAKGMSIRHTGDVKDKIKQAQKALNIAVEDFADYKEKAEILYRAPIEIKAYASDVLDACLEITQAQVDMGANVLAAAISKTIAQQDLLAKSFERKIEKREEILLDIIERYESEKCGLNGIRGTAWSAFNAITEHADHAKQSRESADPLTRASRRFESVISGAADEMKQVAFSTALEYVSRS